VAKGANLKSHDSTPSSLYSFPCPSARGPKTLATTLVPPISTYALPAACFTAPTDMDMGRNSSLRRPSRAARGAGALTSSAVPPARTTAGVYRLLSIQPMIWWRGLALFFEKDREFLGTLPGGSLCSSPCFSALAGFEWHAPELHRKVIIGAATGGGACLET